MIEPLLFGIVLGLIPVTLAGLFVAAYLQYAAKGTDLVISAGKEDPVELDSSPTL